ncbi:MAG: neutral/alkaline non-lysosomal ceramidase N-terminal domain-containing protein [Candidatus Latescibacteria bacterium]|jgi:predicted neutral ceramidase superfamily lipid hydrolase|nr:neutral/alkaline non-lysosomal ceramidase N-terminal domain-containing protein [Candidatus Latescibacterota bacterium]
MVKAGFAKEDITPRVGVEMTGFGPYILRQSTGVRDRLWAKAMVVSCDGERILLIACDLLGVSLDFTNRVRAKIEAHTGISKDAIMLACSHTHSGPAVSYYIGWGERDMFYVETLPVLLVQAAKQAIENLAEVTFAHAEVPCEGIGINREYDRHCVAPEIALVDNWTPDCPELTDTTCHVVTAKVGEKLVGFF